MSSSTYDPWTTARVLLLLFGLIVALAVLVYGAFYLLLGRDFVNVTWPEGKTQAIRSAIETALPPPDGTVFVNVRLYAGLDLPYTEELYYLSDRSQAEILDHYRAILEKHGWFVRVYHVEPPNTVEPRLTATNRPLIPTIAPIPGPSPGSPPNQAPHDMTDPESLSHIGIYFSTIGRARENARFTYIVSSDSLERAARILAAGR